MAAIIERITEAGDIYKGEYEGWYDARDEAFVPDSQVKDGVDTESGNPVERLSESSYFFRLSAFQDRLLEWYRANPECIRPKSRYNEVLRFVEGGLKDLSISRTSLKWGVPYPGDEDHVVYVWLDALTNYISALGFGSDDEARYDEFWPASLHLVGKDILRFHCVYWPAFLMSAGLPLPDTGLRPRVVAPGRRQDVEIGGQRGPTRSPHPPFRRRCAALLRGARDVLRSGRQLLRRGLPRALQRRSRQLPRQHRVAHHGHDDPNTSTAWSRRRRTEGPVPEAAAVAVEKYIQHMDALEPNRALEAAWQLLSTINVFLQDKQPWNLAKNGDEGRAELESVLYAALEGLRIASILAEPFMPGIAAELRAQLGVERRSPSTWTTPPNGAGCRPGPSSARPSRSSRGSTSRPISRRSQQENEKKAEAEAIAQGDLVTIDDFAKIQLKVGLVMEAERLPKSKKLMKIMVDLGEGQPRQLVAGIAERYEPEQLVGRRIVVVANLQPAKLMGVESRGMLLAASIDGEPYLLSVDDEVPPGTRVK